MTALSTIRALEQLPIALTTGKFSRLSHELRTELDGAHALLAEDLGERWYAALRAGRRDLDECAWRITLLDGRLKIMFDSRSARTYFTSADACTCPGFDGSDPEKPCYHRAIYLLLAVAAQRLLHRHGGIEATDHRPGGVILAELPYIPGVHYNRGVWDGTPYETIERRKWGEVADPVAAARELAAVINAGR